jgi:tyrosinase
MWQTIYPNTYTTAQTATTTSYTIAVNDVEDANSRLSAQIPCILHFANMCLALTPFHKDTVGTFHTSNDVRDWTTLHYTYPEFLSGGGAQQVMSYVNALYGPQATAKAGSIHAKKATKHKRHSHLESRELAPNVTFAAPPVELISTSNGSRYEYTANIATQRFALDGTYNIFVFLGNFSSDSQTWPFDQALVGTYGIFSTKGMTGMIGNHSVSGTVPLTRALTQQVDAGNLEDLSVETVAEYLQNNLQWRVASSNGSEIPAANVPGLQVSIVTANATLPADSEAFPVFGEWATLPAITHGKAGGLQQNMTVAWRAAKAAARRSGMVGHF